jgi:hypothetical protein
MKQFPSSRNADRGDLPRDSPESTQRSQTPEIASETPYAYISYLYANDRKGRSFGLIRRTLNNWRDIFLPLPHHCCNQCETLYLLEWVPYASPRRSSRRTFVYEPISWSPKTAWQDLEVRTSEAAELSRRPNTRRSSFIALRRTVTKRNEASLPLTQAHSSLVSLAYRHDSLPNGVRLVGTFIPSPR